MFHSIIGSVRSECFVYRPKKMLTNLFQSIILFVILRQVKGAAPKELPNDVPQKTTLKSNSDYVPTPDTWEVNPNSMWAYRPSVLSPKDSEPDVHQVSLKAPYAVTRLAKSLTFGFDPYFNKGYFEPFERRQKPVTLVAFKRNGWLPKQIVKVEDGQEPSEMAEMQSPFNDISSFWQDEPGLFYE